MSVENTIGLQNQVRENSEDLQNFLKDLDSWEKDMKKKEEEFKLIQLVDEQAVPPIRNSLSRSKKKNRHKKMKKKEAPEKDRISSFDYKAWEKFDVDSELKKLDEEKEESSGSESSDSEERLSIQKKQQLAIIKKDKGNEFFKNGNYDSAINSYTIGMDLDPENALLPANRAMAFLKKEQFQAAENDCTLCLSLDSTYIKAYLRRGTARKALEKFKLAKSDFLKALELEPDNKQAQLELKKLNVEVDVKAHNQDAKQSLKTNPSDVNNIEVNEESITNMQHFPHLMECASSDDDDDDAPCVEKCTLFPEAEEVPISMCNEEFHEDSFTKLEISSYSHEELKEILEKESLLKETENYKNKKNDINTNAQQPLKPIDLSSNLNHENLSNGIENVIAVLEQKLPPIPTASYQFLTDWKKLSKYPDLRYQYLKQFPPEKLSVLFKHYMEPEIFPEILSTLSTLFIENGDDVFHYLKHLTSVGRFSTMLMFMSDPEKKDLRKLLSYVEMSGYSELDMKELLTSYRI